MYIVGAVEIVLVRLKIQTTELFSFLSTRQLYAGNGVIKHKTFVHPLFFLYLFCRTLSQTYMAPWLSIFGDFTKDPEIMYNNFRVYGTGLLLVMGEFPMCEL